MKTALVDGDIIVYRMAFACQKTIYTHKETGEFFEGIAKAKEWFKEYAGFHKQSELKTPKWMEKWWDENDWNIELVVEPVGNLYFLIDNLLQRIMDATGADNCRIFLSPKKCFRHDIATVAEYKGNRKQEPPVHKDAAREYLIQWYGAEEPENLEADDGMGMAQTTETIICSVDKDMLQVPGHHYNFVDEVTTTVDLYEGDCWFFQQLISGDPTDNIKGLPGLGEAKAARIVESWAGNHVGLVEYIAQLYEDEYPGRGVEVMEETAQLVYILRKGDILGETEQWRVLLGAAHLSKTHGP
jgi:hypothetical protein